MGLSRFVVATILGASGCDFVFPLVAPDAPPAFDVCAAAYDDPGMRYTAIANPNVIAGTDGPILLPWPWSEARTACQLRGMDLAVFNDEHEAGQVDGADSWPYWIGETVDTGGWAAIDGCSAFFGSTAQPSSMPQCGAITSALELTPAACDGSQVIALGAIVTAALCETPRPPTTDCLSRSRAAVPSYTVSPGPLAFDDARTFCKRIGAHLAVVDSAAEWKQISMLTIEGNLPRLWIGSTFTGTTWDTETHCPAVYSWATGKPDFTGGGTCLATVVADDTSEDHMGTRLDGVAVTSCADGAVFALCEPN